MLIEGFLVILGSPSYNMHANGLDPIFEVGSLRDANLSPETEQRIHSRRTHGKAEKSGFCFKDTLGTPMTQFQGKEDRLFSPDKDSRIRETSMLQFAIQTPETATFAEKSILYSHITCPTFKSNYFIWIW